MGWKAPETDEVVSEKNSGWKAPDSDEVISKDPSMGDYLNTFSAGIGEGLTTILGAPTDITSSILRSAGIVSESAKPPFGGKESLKKGFEAAGFSFEKPAKTTGGRIIARAGEELGAASFPMMGMYKGALGAAKVAAGATTSLARKILLDPIAKAPGSAALQDITSTITAGLGGGVAKEMVPESKTAETAGQIAGGFAPMATALSPTRLVIKAVRSLTSRFSSKAQIDAARKTIEKVMGSSLDKEAMDALSSAGKLTEKTGGQFKPSIAESTGVPSLIAAQKQIEKEASGDFLNWVQARKVNNIKAIDNFIGKTAPTGEVSPEIIIDSASNKISLMGDKIERTVSGIVQTRKDLASGLPTIDKIGTGTLLRDALVKARSQASLKMSELADSLNLAGVDMTEAFNKWKEGVKENYKPTSRFDDPASRPAIIARIVSDKSKTTSFIDVKALRERVSDDLIDELSSANPSRRKVRTLTLLKKDVDTLFEEAGGEAGESLAQFRKTYFEDYVKPFETGAMFKAKNKDGTGFFRTRDEKVADLFLDNPTAARQFKLVFGGDQSTMKAIEDSLMDKLRTSTVVDGLIDEKKLTAFAKKNADVLNELPTLKSKLSNIQEVQKSLLERQVQLAARKDLVEKNTLAKQLIRYGKGDVTADVILNSALKDSRKMKFLTTFLQGDKEAIDALKRTVWEKASNGTSADILKFMAEHETSLKSLFTPQHFNDLQDITAMRTMTEVMPSQSGVAHIPKPLEHIEKAMGMGVPQASTRWYALMTGRLSQSYLMVDIAKSVLLSKGRANIEALLRDALYDPAVAREMASAVRSGVFSEKVGRRLSSRVFSLALPYLRKDKPLEDVAENAPNSALPPFDIKLEPGVDPFTKSIDLLYNKPKEATNE